MNELRGKIVDDIRLTLITRKEKWRKAQQTAVQLGNEIAENDHDCLDIRDRMYEWSDEALSRSRECEAILNLIGKNNE